MNSETIKRNIENALKTFDQQPLRQAATQLLDVLGYRSKRISNDALDNEKYNNFRESALATANPSKKLRLEKWQSYSRIMQITDEEINQQRTPEQQFLFDSADINENLRTSYMFVGLEIDGPAFTRTQLADITRFICKEARYSIMVMFRYSDYLSLAIINRRHHKRDKSRQVLEKVTLIKDINLNKPNRAHIEIIYDLYLSNLIQTQEVKNFDTLHDAWEKILNTEELNKQFYRKLFAWYEWALETAKFPTDENRVIKPEEHVIRLITRLLFIWFIKEKGLVEEELFKEEKVRDLLKTDDFENGDSYYRVVLQNLFFATLNTEIDKRKFSKESYDTNRDFSCYRYKKQMDDPDRLLSLYAKTPFINGGLFDCLDTFEGPKDGGYRIDCFSDVDYKKLSIPNRLFFHENRGLLPLLEHYKFTVEENTPIDQEVALDPELLGRVFEHLLAEFNPETRKNAASERKKTGSYYTPRVIVDYMVEETLVTAISQKCQPTDGNTELWDERLHYLFDYAKVCDDANEWFDDQEIDGIVKTISELKILDPAVGSGAFPMGVLHKLTLALRRLDSENNRWEALQKGLAGKRAAEAFDTQDDHERLEELHEIDDTFKRYRDSDFGRKLYLIQNSIFGVDIQPIACQVAKLRFFISLAIEQEPDRNADNFGIKPLPNLETRFVATNTLISIKAQLRSKKAVKLELKLRDNRERYFHATTRKQKRACKTEDKRLRSELATELKNHGMLAADAKKIAEWDLYDQNATANWFDKELMFGIKSGFDVVIGNPPYIKEYTNREAFDGVRESRYYQGKMDIWYMFACQGLDLIKKDNGLVTFIAQNNWVTSAGASIMRNKVIQDSQILSLVDFGSFKIFSSGIQTMIMAFRKDSEIDNYLFDYRRLLGKKLNINDAIALLNKDRNNKAEYIDPIIKRSKYTNTNLTFNDYTVELILDKIVSKRDFTLNKKEIAQGIVPNPDVVSEKSISLIPSDKVEKLGLSVGDSVFVIPKGLLPNLSVEEKGYIKPVYEPTDLRKYYIPKESCKDIIYLTKDNWKQGLQTLIDHLHKYREIMEARRENINGKRDFFHLHWPRDETFFQAGAKIMSVRKCETPTFVYTDRPAYVMMAINIIKSKRIKLKYLTGILNSKLVTFWLKHRGKMQGTNFQIDKEPLLAIPLIAPPLEEQVTIASSVDQILDAKQANPDADISSLEDEIDKLVYELYNLTEEDIAIVEGSV